MHKTLSRLALIAAGIAAATAAPVLAQASGWQQQVARIIASKQTYPRTAQMRGEEGTAKVRITIGADGAVEKTELAAGSGSATLDKEALALPTKVGTLPAPPAGATTITLPFTWKLI